MNHHILELATELGTACQKASCSNCPLRIGVCHCILSEYASYEWVEAIHDKENRQYSLAQIAKAFGMVKEQVEILLKEVE